MSQLTQSYKTSLYYTINLSNNLFVVITNNGFLTLSILEITSTLWISSIHLFMQFILYNYEQTIVFFSCLLKLVRLTREERRKELPHTHGRYAVSNLQTKQNVSSQTSIWILTLLTKDEHWHWKIKFFI